jgi:predicted transcriptional regulator
VIVSAVDELCRSYLDARWHFDPSAASAAGLTTHDGRLGRYDEAGVRELTAALRALAGAAEELDTADQDEEIDRTALLDELRVAVFRFQHEQPHRRNPAFWLRHFFDGLHALAARPDADEATAASVVARLRDAPAFLDAARDTLTEPPRVLSDAALAMLGGGGELIVGLVQRFGTEAPALRPGLEEAAAGALAALKVFGAALTGRITPSADPTAFAVGEAQFNRRLHHEHALLASAPELWRYGLHLRDEVETELEQVARRIDPSRHWRDLVERLREQSAPEEGALLGLYAAEVERARAFLADGALVSLTEAPLEVEATPGHLRAVVPLAAYHAAPAYAPHQTARLLVSEPTRALGDAARQRLLRDHARLGIPSLVAHEALPGRHQHAARTRGLSEVRRHVGTPLSAAGWALYAEDVMADAGYLQGLEERLFQLVRRLWFAVRVDLDIGLHTRGMTAEEAVEELVRRLPMERRHAEPEVLWLCQSPTYGLCDAVGRRELLALRESYVARERTAFSMSGFHDELLGYGALPVSLVRWGMGLDG